MYRLLTVECDETLQEAIVGAFADGPIAFETNHLKTADALNRSIQDEPVDALLLGAGRPAEALEALARCRLALPDKPIILLTDDGDGHFAREALRAGAQDVVLRGDRSLALLSRIVRYAIERAGSDQRQQRLRQESASLKLLLDALVARAGDGIVQIDAFGAIERASPTAAALLRKPWPPPSGARLTDGLALEERRRLAAFIAVGNDGGAAAARSQGGLDTIVFNGCAQGEVPVLQLERIASAAMTDGAAQLFRLSELAADFAGDSPQLAPATPLDRARPGTMTVMGAAAANATASAEGTAPPRGAQPLAVVRSLGKTASWRCRVTEGKGGAAYGLLVADPTSTASLVDLEAASRTDSELSAAIDALQLAGWRSVVARAPDALPDRLVLEVGYGTVVGQGQFEQLLAAAAAELGDVVERLDLVLTRIPKQVHVPTLAKTLRAMSGAHGAVGLSLTDLGSDYRLLPFAQLKLLLVDIADLKKALSADAKQLATLVRRAQADGCRVAVRGVTGALADALRDRLGIALTVAA